MAIRLIQGKIDSGKAYYAVNHVLKSYYTWSDELDSWVPGLLKQNPFPPALWNLKLFHLGFLVSAGELVN
ncbi:hypothetical protein SCALIN_C04_0339 [Candidatus Scalindua japonica]|uniref:Uncharacterized protein n=1 Tax=Candidatus Scalindua japonica TaxID=1284222 RepID=A0A286TVI7_9BACT|nr:hypothetical protein [Candidatus Scalindua japonica]GAX59851.1 hypothetical protein SCALIN_C04_0339 [Candidatus Scalindua japonica]